MSCANIKKVTTEHRYSLEGFPTNLVTVVYRA